MCYLFTFLLLRQNVIINVFLSHQNPVMSHCCLHLCSVQFTTSIWRANKGHDYHHGSCSSQSCGFTSLTERLNKCESMWDRQGVHQWSRAPRLRDGSYSHSNRAQIAGVLLWVFNRTRMFPPGTLCPTLIVSVIEPWPVMCEHIPTWHPSRPCVESIIFITTILPGLN